MGKEKRRGQPPRPSFEFWAACPDFSSGEIIHYITDELRSKEISYSTFARHVNLAPLREHDHPAMYRISAPDNWAISFHRSTLPDGRPIYYFDWSRMEYIFVDPARDPPGLEEMVELARKVERNPPAEAGPATAWLEGPSTARQQALKRSLMR